MAKIGDVMLVRVTETHTNAYMLLVTPEVLEQLEHFDELGNTAAWFGNPVASKQKLIKAVASNWSYYPFGDEDWNEIAEDLLDQFAGEGSNNE